MVDRIAVISHGRISEIGSYDELMTHNGDFAQFLKSHLLKEDSDSEESDEEDPESKKAPENLMNNCENCEAGWKRFLLQEFLKISSQ